jgi:hypothetical protein
VDTLTSCFGSKADLQYGILDGKNFKNLVPKLERKMLVQKVWFLCQIDHFIGTIRSKNTNAFGAHLVRAFSQ